MIDTVNNPQLRNKMASFDYDWTLVNPKNGDTFPKSIKDWVWLYPEIPKKLKELYEDGYMIVIFTNQSKEWKCQQISLVMKTLEIPVFIVIATEKETYKPNPVLLKNLLGENNIDKDKSFFVGDALGRPTDLSDSDKTDSASGESVISFSSSLSDIDEWSLNSSIPIFSELSDAIE